MSVDEERAEASLRPGFISALRLGDPQVRQRWPLLGEWLHAIAHRDEPAVPLLLNRGDDPHDALLTLLDPTAVEEGWRDRASKLESPTAAALYGALPAIWLAYAEYGRGLPCILAPAFPNGASQLAVDFLPLARWEDPQLQLPRQVRADQYTRLRTANFNPATELLALLLEEDLASGKLLPQLVSIALDPDAGAIGRYMLRLGSLGLGEGLMPPHEGRLN